MIWYWQTCFNSKKKHFCCTWQVVCSRDSLPPSLCKFNLPPTCLRVRESCCWGFFPKSRTYGRHVLEKTYANRLKTGTVAMSTGGAVRFLSCMALDFQICGATFIGKIFINLLRMAFWYGVNLDPRSRLLQ